MKSLLLALLLFSVLSFAADKTIIFTADNCDELIDQAQAILTWSNKLGEHLDTPLPRCTCSGSRCEMDFYSISPRLAQQYHNVKPMISGPNCWNRALVFAGILPTLSYSGPEQMSHWTNSPLCTKREEGETPMPGDVVAIRSNANSEVHGFTYLSDKLSFSKNGYSKYSPYKYQTTASVFDVYDVSDECWNVPNTPAYGSTCYRARGTFYSCISLDQYLENMNLFISEQTRDIMNELTAIGDLLFKRAFGLGTENYKFFQTKKNRLTAIRKLAIEQLSNLNDDQEEFLWQGIRYRAEALIAQADMVISAIKWESNTGLRD